MREADLCLARAGEALEEARALCDVERWNGALTRAYYAMYQAAQALLSEADVVAKTHRGVQARLRELNVLESEALQHLAKAQQLREKADYDVTFHAEKADATEACERAASFVRDVERQLA